MRDLRKAINSPEILSVKEGKGNNALSDCGAGNPA